MIQQELKAGKIVELEGAAFRMAPGEIEPGDWYIAERKTGPKLLTAKKIHDNGYILNREGAYPYDIHECVKVELV